MAAQTFGPNSLARAMGIMLPVDSIGQTCFPFVLGLMHDRFENYHSGLITVSALALAGALAISLLPDRAARAKRPEVVCAANK